MQTKHNLNLQHILGQLPSTMANMKKENVNFRFLVPSSWRTSTGSVWTTSGRTNIPVNRCTISLHEDAAAVLQKYNALTERNKGKLEQFLDTLYEQQAQQKEAQSSG